MRAKIMTGVTTLEFMIVFMLVGVLIGVAGNIIWEIRISSERVAVIKMLSNIQTSFNLQLLRLIAKHQKIEKDFNCTNPMELLSHLPDNYAGIIDDSVAAINVPNGQWYFDKKHCILGYKIEFSENYSTIDNEESTRARFTVKYVYTNSKESVEAQADAGSITGIKLVLLGSISWLKEYQSIR